MKGLLYKEYAVLKSQMKSWLILLAFFVVYTGIFRNISIAFMMISIMGLMNCYHSFHYDKQYRCNDYIAAMPVSRFRMVLAKYVFVMLLDAGLASVSLILAALWGWGESGSFLELSVSAAVSVGGLLFMQILSLPLIYAIGVERARYVNMLLWILPWMIVFMAVKNGRPLPLSKELMISLMHAAPLLFIVFLAVSFGISVFVFRRKDI
ncbi:ABC-2 transporter permease [Clostridiaceae bacterium]|nr:ABC-2 transporter permease [Clostridiaceae bacterium]